MSGADVVITDGTNALTLKVEQISFDVKRMPKVFSMKSLPGLGAPTTIATDFGAYAKLVVLSGFITSRATAKTLLDYVHDEWFVNRGASGITVTIPAITGRDDDALLVSASPTQPIITRTHVFHDLEQSGPTELRFEIRIAVVRRL